MRLFWIASALILVVLTAVIIRQEQHMGMLQGQVEQALTPRGQTRLYGKAFLETITLGAYDGASDEIEVLEAQRAAWQQAQRVARLATGAFLVLGLILIGSALVYGRTHGIGLTSRMVSVHTLGLSVLLFLLGITTPLIHMTVTSTIPGLGTALIQSTTKGIVAAIGDLWTTHPALAILVLTFSVVLPIVKLGLVAWVLIGPQIPRRGVHRLHRIGTWSMADVFVVAVVIVILSPLGQGRIVQTHAQPGLGLYFFAASCLLSLVTTVLLSRTLDPQRNTLAQHPRLVGMHDDL